MSARLRNIRRDEDWRSSRRGVALMLVLWLVVILGVIAAEVLTGTRTSVAVAINTRARAVARAAAESGVEATVAMIEDSLATMTDSTIRSSFLNSLSTRQADDSISLGAGRAIVAISDPGAQIDVNAAPAEKLAILLGRFTDRASAADMAARIRAYVELGSQDGRTARGRALSTPETPRATHPIRSLDELRNIEDLDDRVLQLAAAYLTVDGDGTINRAVASDTVMDAAFGEIRDAPTRLVVISRGWESGHALTHEIQGVFAISNDRLVLVQWRERTR
ncbi:MAG: hypothetical protein ABIT38_13090 [Gemmatimonadaceae bacterium]